MSALIVLADQFTKVLIVGWFRVGEAQAVTDFFRLVRVHNAGAAFSMLSDASGWQRWFFIGVGAIATVFVLWQLRMHGAQKLFALALACILGGAVGNVIDRIWHGYVVDFLDFHWAGIHFPAFNVADSAITVGVVLLLLDEFLRVRRQR